MSVSEVVSDHERVRNFLDHFRENIGDMLVITPEKSTGIQRWSIGTMDKKFGVLFAYGLVGSPTTLQYCGRFPGYQRPDGVEGDWVQLTFSPDYEKLEEGQHDWAIRKNIDYTPRKIVSDSWQRRDKHDTIPFGNSSDN